MKSALSDGLLGALKGGAAGSGLKKVDAPAEPKMDERTQLLRSIQLGSVQLKSNAAKPKPKIEVKVRVHKLYARLCCSVLIVSVCISLQQNEAVAAILANRSKIAGSDSESSDDSDSDYTDDDY